MQGHQAEARITVLSGSAVNPIHLNKHIDYTKLAGSPGFDFTANYIPVSGGGPSGVILEAGNRAGAAAESRARGGGARPPHALQRHAISSSRSIPKVNTLDAPDSGPTGDQIRGFGFTNDGSIDTIFRFLTAAIFRPLPFSGFPSLNADGTRRDVEQLVLAFDSDLAPIVGQQVTLTPANAEAVSARSAVMEQRAGAQFVSKAPGGVVTECDLVATVVQGGRVQGLLYHPAAANFVAADGTTAVSDAALRALAATDGQEITYTRVPRARVPGSRFQ